MDPDPEGPKTYGSSGFGSRIHNVVPFVNVFPFLWKTEPGIFIDNLEAEGEGGLMGGSLPLLCLERPGRNSSLV